MTVRHHELCFGCGRANLFGLLAEIEPMEGGRVTGRCFIKQDHQGPDPGFAHPGVVVAALLEAIALAGGEATPNIEVRFVAPAPVGAFLELEADRLTGRAGVEGREVATARASYG